MRALLFSLSAVALTLITSVPGPWEDDSPERRTVGPSVVVAVPPAFAPAITGTVTPSVAAASTRSSTSTASLTITPSSTPAPQQIEGIPREFYFSRAAYTGYGRGFRGGGSWATDYPKADQIFLSFIDRLLSNLDGYEHEHPILLDDPDLRRFPFLYAVEVGRMALREPEIVGLRNYLLQGGFLVVDDFWGTRQWANFEYEIQAVLPGYEIVDLTLDHPIFTAFYEIEEILQVPNVNNGIRGGPTHQSDGYVPMFKGIHDETGRLMVAINWNTDLGDAWEWADNPRYPLKYSTFAYEMGVNMIVYAMSH